MTLLERIAADLDAITPDQIQYCTTSLDAPKPEEKILGTITDPHTHRLWAVAFEYCRRSRKLAYEGMYETVDKDARELVLAECRYLDDLGDAVREIAWCAVKQEIGPPAWEGGGVGLRAGFVAVAMPEEAASKANLLGAIKLPAALGQMLAQMGHAAGLEVETQMVDDDDNDDPKPTHRHRRHPRKPS